MTVGIKIELEDIDEKVVVHIEGRLDAPSTPTLEKKINALIDDGKFNLLLDFSKVEYLSSAGMRLLLSASKKIKSKDGKLVIFSIHDDVLDIIKLAGFDKILNICRTELDALQF
jgi:anti-anti-sigma factor